MLSDVTKIGGKVTFLATALVCLLLSGCATKSETARDRYLWPPSAEHAKIEYIDFYQSDDLGKLGKLDKFSEAIRNLGLFLSVVTVPNGEKDV